jgi:single-stranded-DNA-specific exonuclease
MKLLGINRSFVVHGMIAMQQTARIGLQLLMVKANVDPKEISTDTLNYVLAPRINAMGRLKHSLDALRLVCTSSWDRANELVNELNTTNTTRQGLTTDMIAHAMEQAEQWQDQHVIVVAAVEYHEGVIGLLAGKLMEEFYKPAIAISINGKVAKASARSIPGVNITEFLRLVRDDLLEVGGHPMAAGFAVLPEKVELVKERLQKVDVLKKFAPFGQGNPEPIFSTPVAQVLAAGQIGKEARHLKLEVGFQTEQGMTKLSCLAWGSGQRVNEFPAGTQVELAGCLSVNEWKGRKTLQMVVKDVRANS